MMQRCMLAGFLVLPLSGCAEIALGSAPSNSSSIKRIAPIAYPDSTEGWAEFCGSIDGATVSPLIGTSTSAVQAWWSGDSLHIAWHVQINQKLPLVMSGYGEPTKGDRIEPTNVRTWRGVTTLTIEVPKAVVDDASSGLRLRLGPKRGINRRAWLRRPLLDALTDLVDQQQEAYCFVPGLKGWMRR